MRIVYVEDNPANLFLVKRVARIGSHEVIGYIDGEDALAHFEQDKPDLVLMDIQLSGELSGLEVVQKIRAAGHKIPIVAVTAYAMVGDRERCMEAGCDDYVAKPLPVPQLVGLFQRFQPATPPAPVAQPAADSPASEGPLDTQERAALAAELSQQAILPDSDAPRPPLAAMESQAKPESEPKESPPADSAPKDAEVKSGEQAASEE